MEHFYEFEEIDFIYILLAIDDFEIHSSNQNCSIIIYNILRGFYNVDFIFPLNNERTLNSSCKIRSSVIRDSRKRTSRRINVRGVNKFKWISRKMVSRLSARPLTFFYIRRWFLRPRVYGS